MSVIAIVQARMGSVRLPGKVMREVVGRPLIGLLLERLAHAEKLDRIVLATSSDPGNEALKSYAEGLGYDVYQGSETDVLDRYHGAALKYGASTIVRVTGDCPLVDPELVDAVVQRFQHAGVDYASNIAPPTFPDGLDVEAFSFETLDRIWREAQSTEEREHVTDYVFRSRSFRTANVAHSCDRSDERWTVDEPADLQVIQSIFEHFRPRTDFSWLEVLELRKEVPELFAANRRFERNSGSGLGSGQKLWERAKRVIPGGNMLLSKRSEMFAPEQWPAYFSKASDCRVWDLDGRQYVDMSIMGVGTNVLGYGHPEVDAAVRHAIDAGNMSTLNCPEEVYLAEKLIELHPWAEMVRFARTGGEANAVGIRIARAATGRDKVAFCGYHGWHDWYLAANLAGESLGEHLLPELRVDGVPKNLSDTILPFNYNRFDELQSLIENHDVGTIMMEVSRNEGPMEGFLQQVRDIATANGIVLVFDECTSGFRQTDGGLHKLYGVEPDMAIFGKALGNGYAITATIGRREIMEAAQSSFISSTFWTERIGPTAALKTLEVMQSSRSWEQITRTGLAIGESWRQLAVKHGLKIEVSGLPALTSFAVQSPHASAYNTLICQEMLDKGYLATNCVYVCTEHTEAVVAEYVAALDPVFELIRSCEDGRDVLSLLRGPVRHEGFRRLN